jgi:signal transduction histidine kinase
VSRPTLLGQLSRAHVTVVIATCAMLVVAAITGSAVLLRSDQDRLIESIATEVANGVEAEAAETGTLVEGAAEYFRETRLSDFSFELLGKDGALLAAAGKLPGWSPKDYEIPVEAKALTPRLLPGAAGHGRFRGCARWCGDRYIVRVVTPDVLGRPEIRRLGIMLLAALPAAALFGTVIGRAVFRARLTPLAQLENAAGSSSAAPGVTLNVDANAREIATLQEAFNGLLARLGDVLSRERRFSQEASHELRTPLAALRGRIERLGHDGPLSAGQKEHLDKALQEADALDRLIDALLLLARSESATLPGTPVNLCDLARDVAGRQAEKDGAAARPPEVEAPDEVLVRGSEELLARAIGNLVENARKFAGPRARIRIRVAQDGANATVAVADDGPGIPAADRERIFDRFYRAPASRASKDGVGLGLAVAKTIASRHHGFVEATASDLGGAELRIAIPRLIG